MTDVAFSWFSRMSGVRVLRVLIISTLGVCAYALPGPASAGCDGDATVSLNGNYGWTSAICVGDDGNDDDRTGSSGTLIDYDTTADTWLGVDDSGVNPQWSGPIYGLPGGVLTLYSGGGVGYEEGGGGTGGEINVNNAGEIELRGGSESFFNSLIQAQSVGGSGDQDNDNNNSDGGAGGDGGDINITNDGELVIQGDVPAPIPSELFGIYARSAGGQGGEQNDSMFDNQHGGHGGNGRTIRIQGNGSIQMGSSEQRLHADLGAAVLAVAEGGTGGDYNGSAGVGGEIYIDSEQDIEAYWSTDHSSDDDTGDRLFGIAARSAGGVGQESKDNSDPGGRGGDGGHVYLHVNGNVNLDVEDAAGDADVGAAVVGGSYGGKGGLSPDKNQPGGDGGSANFVGITLGNTGETIIQTHGNSIHGVVAQAVGGEGGDGKDGAAVVGSGGGGGYGGNVNNSDPLTVQASADTSISTAGDYAFGVIAQSVGGGGGTGGDFVSVLAGGGGNGGNGGDSGSVLVSSAAQVETRGDHAIGVLGQSIAGGGGAGGVSVSAITALGGDGSGGGTAYDVTIQNMGSIHTTGRGSHGLDAESIGGGGGTAGSSLAAFAVGGDAASNAAANGGTVTVTNAGEEGAGSITTEGNAAIGILAQSIGGGGGAGGSVLGIAGVGGDGSSAGSGGAVKINGIGQVSTRGKYSPGVVAQSIGGGGGDGGSSLTFSIGGSLGIGGMGASGGDGGSVCLGNTGACGDTVAEPSQVVTHGDYAPGIIAQNIGGGGGNGGSAHNGSIASFAALQIGGVGGAGGDAGTDGTRLDFNDLTIHTGQAHAPGILAQSIGGGGGNGGDASYLAASVGLSVVAVVGGSGGDGGYGASTDVHLHDSHVATGMDYASADPTTYAPNDSFGILAQTIGGGGGNGGSSAASTVILGVPTSYGSLSLDVKATVGGSAGGGGDACDPGDTSCVTQVVLDGTSSVATLGDGSHGIVAQSIGGGGGNGGDASSFAAGIDYGPGVSAKVEMAFGGSGGDGGNGGPVHIALGNSGGEYAALPEALPDELDDLPIPEKGIVTYGDMADAVVAQSVGGGGGNGGTGSSSAYHLKLRPSAPKPGKSIKGLTSFTAKIGIGGSGGGGGDGGRVDVSLLPDFTLHTVGSGSRGILAQSIGGGGGTSQGGTLAISAGPAIMSLGVGMSGGEGGNGDAVSATVNGAIRTEGGDADGVVLQSIGGGGGVGGSLGADASAHPILDRIGGARLNYGRIADGQALYRGALTIGGSGGAGGTGGPVDLQFGGKIATSGDWADGVVAQSIGGGGGQGGLSVASGSKVKFSTVIGIGGTGGVGGDGGTVSANINGSHDSGISTQGYYAHGIVLQSIGGGGGMGGDGSDHPAATFNLGGGIGGSGGVAGTGGKVTIGENGSSWAVIQTHGEGAIGLLAQSIGGGGGTGGVGNADMQSLAGVGLDLTVGGFGGTGNAGGPVDLRLGTNTTTHGDRAFGIVAQSIGGGGGLAGASSSDLVMSVVVGGQGGVGGDGGAVNISLADSSTIETSGAGAHGIVAQSIGGGGGIAGDTTHINRFLQDVTWESFMPVANSDEPGAQGSGAAVDISTGDSTIGVTGSDAFGIVAQSIGGGGGLAGDAEGGIAGSTGGEGSTGHGGPVTIHQEGVVSATGTGGIGILAQSTGPEGGEVINIDVQGQVLGGSGESGTAIRVIDGRDNVLQIGTDGEVIAAEDGTAIHYQSDAGSDQGATLTVSSQGLISGDVLCANADGVGDCGVPMGKTATLQNAALVQADVTSAGHVVTGGHGLFASTTITGDYTQLSTGVLDTTVDFVGRRAGHLDVLGSARLDGDLVVNTFALMPGRDVPVLNVTGDTQGSLQVRQSPIFDYALTTHGHQQRLRVTDAHLKQGRWNLAGRQGRVADYLQNVWDDGSSEQLGRLFGLLNVAAEQGADVYSDRLSDLSPGASLAPAAEMKTSLMNFAGPMMSCHDTSGQMPWLEQDCVWGQMSYRHARHGATDGQSSYTFDNSNVQLGAQRTLTRNWLLGGYLAYQHSRIETSDGRVDGNGDAGFAGVVLKRRYGLWEFAGALSGGFGSYQMDRNLAFADYERSTSGDPDVYSVGIRLRTARYLPFANHLYFKPYLDLDAVYTRMPAYTESGDALSLHIQSSDQYVVSVSPMLEFGGWTPVGKSSVVRPFAYVGVTQMSQAGWDTDARLTGAPTDVPAMHVSLPGDRTVARFGAGVQVNTGSGWDVRLQYDGSSSSNTSSYAGQLKLVYRY